MTLKDPDERYDAKQCLAHEWFQGETASQEELKAHYMEATGKQERKLTSEEEKEKHMNLINKMREDAYQKVKIKR